MMATFEYEAILRSEAGEDHFERGFVVAPSLAAAEQKLKSQQLEPRRVQPVPGLKGLIKAFTADIR
jgi:type II secretory pathway component PulF